MRCMVWLCNTYHDDEKVSYNIPFVSLLFLLK